LVEGSVGMSIKIVSPSFMHLPPGKVVLHELTHIITNDVGVLPQWLFQGIAMYEGRETSIHQIETTVKSGVLNDKIPTIDDLSLVEYVIDKSGFAKISELIHSPYDYIKIFAISKKELYINWKESLNVKYK